MAIPRDFQLFRTRQYHLLLLGYRFPKPDACRSQLPDGKTNQCKIFDQFLMFGVKFQNFFLFNDSFSFSNDLYRAKARMISMLILIAFSERSTEESMETPCSVNTMGLMDECLIIDNRSQFATSSSHSFPVSSNI